MVRYRVDARPAIAKLAIAQQRLYCLRVRAAKSEAADFFEEDAATSGGLRAEMEDLVESYVVAPVDAACLAQSDKGEAPAAACRVLRP